MNSDVKFSFEGVSGLSAILADNLTKLEEAYKDAQLAATSAVSAVGGESNDIGKVVKQAIADDTAMQMSEAIAIVNNLIDAMTKVSSAYSDQKADILSAINKAIAENSGTSSSNPSHNNMPY